MKPTSLAIAALLTASTFATGCDRDEETVGPRGGTVVSEDGRLVLEIPEGALEDEVTITVEVAEEVGPGGAMSSTYIVEPLGIIFKAPVDLTYEFDASDMDAMDAMDPDTVAVVIEGQQGWNYLADRQVDMQDATVSASLLYTSSVVVVSQ